MKKNLLLLFTITFFSCGNNKRDLLKEGLLMAEREALIGFIHLRIFKDSSFEYEYTDLSRTKIYKGKVDIKEDTIYFEYLDPIPHMGNKAIIEGTNLIYLNGTKETVKIWLDSLSD